MTEVGRIRQIWRYPVKSMGGEALSACSVGALGIPGDRGYALRLEEAGEMCGAKKFPVLMQCRATYRNEPGESDIPPVHLELANGKAVESDAAEVHERLSEMVGKAVTLWPRRPADDHEHYRRRITRDEATLRQVLGLEDGEPFPDFSVLPQELLTHLRDYTSPLGTYFDAYPIHFVTTGWLEELARHRSASRFEAPRFRPNFVIEAGGGSAIERGWAGRSLRVGGAVLDCTIPTVRCSMTAQATGDLPKDPQVLRTLVHQSGQYLGSYANVGSAGDIRVGDAVELV